MDPMYKDYPWTRSPLIVGAPMRLIALSKLASEITNAGGLGFFGAGTDASTLREELSKTKQLLSVESHGGVLPVGVGFIIWPGDELLRESLPILEAFKPAAVWLFAPEDSEQLSLWTSETRRVTEGKTKIWIQIGTVADAENAVISCKPDVLVVQGTDAGGHGLNQGASIIPLLPEVHDKVSAVCDAQGIEKPALIAAGGIIEGRGAAAALALGAAGVVMGTRYLASSEANIASGYRSAVLDASDGGVTTARTTLYDTLRGTFGWPDRYGGRGVLNESWRDHGGGMSIEENKRLYDEALKKGDDGWGQKARLATYAGSGVGLVGEVKSAKEITEEVREGAKLILKQVSGHF